MEINRIILALAPPNLATHQCSYTEQKTLI